VRCLFRTSALTIGQFGVQLSEPDEAITVTGITPDQLGYRIRPAVPREVAAAGVPRQLAGKEYWRAWVCDVCGMANERRDWSEWDCGACGVSRAFIKRTVLTAAGDPLYEDRILGLLPSQSNSTGLHWS
jgi:hypothetical protein